LYQNYCGCVKLTGFDFYSRFFSFSNIRNANASLFFHLPLPLVLCNLQKEQLRLFCFSRFLIFFPYSKCGRFHYNKFFVKIFIFLKHVKYALQSRMNNLRKRRMDIDAYNTEVV